MKEAKYKNKLRKVREEQKYTLEQVANAIGVSKVYLSNLENGYEKPSSATLGKLREFYKLNKDFAFEATETANDSSLSSSDTSKEVSSMPEEQKQKPAGQTQTQTLQIKVPETLNVLYSDSAFVTASRFGLVFDFAQTVGPTNQQNVVARIGMSKEHAESLMRVLQQKIVEMQAMEEK